MNEAVNSAAFPGWLELSCPECDQALDGRSLRCLQGHQYGRSGGVIRVLNFEMRARMSKFLTPFEKYRAERKKVAMDPSLFRELPYGHMASDQFEWRFRQIGWQALHTRLAAVSNWRILEIGAWIGWLSHRLTQAGHEVIAIDYFVDPLDGLGAVVHYPRQWTAIQLDLERLEIIRTQFDLIIFNHCLQFFVEPLETLLGAQQMLLPGGKILLLGLPFFAKPVRQIQRIKEYRSKFREQGIHFFKPMKGYLDLEDRQQLELQGFDLVPYKALWLANLRARIDRTRPRYEIGWYPNDQWPEE